MVAALLTLTGSIASIASMSLRSRLRGAYRSGNASARAPSCVSRASPTPRPSWKLRVRREAHDNSLSPREVVLERAVVVVSEEVADVVERFCGLDLEVGRHTTDH